MTTNQTIDGVPRELRELLERVATEANHMLGFTYAANYDECRNAVDELRALLDADKCTSCDGSGEYIDAIGDWRGYCTCAAGVALENKPAPVALVPPERLQEIHAFLDGSGTLDGYSFGETHVSGRKFWWRNELRACLDELKRLNPSL